MSRAVPILVIILALVGLADSLYFTFAYYGRIRKARWVPEILCAREGANCLTVLQTPYARVFGLPNSLLGIVYYLVLLAAMIENHFSRERWYVHSTYFEIPLLKGLLILISAGTIVLGFYLIYALRRKLHIDCPLCYTAHAINVAILMLLVVLAS